MVNDATYAAWNAHDADAVAAVFAEDAVIRDAGSSEVEVGRRAVRERAVRLLAAFPDLTLARVDLVVDGSRHADRWIVTVRTRVSCSAWLRPDARFTSKAPPSP